jgi:hypothetical protein
MPKTVAIAAALAQRPGIGGHTWVVLQYLLGFRRLGWDVLFLDRLDPAHCVDHDGLPCAPQDSVQLSYLLPILDRFGLGGGFFVDLGEGQEAIGLTRNQVRAQLDQAALLLNINGYLRDEELLCRPQCRLYLDIDPGFGQMWQELGWHRSFDGHDAYATFGQAIGQPDCPIPDCGLPWIPTVPPVVLGHWPAQSAMTEGCFTSIASWRGSLHPIDFRGKRYGLRSTEFRKFVQLPMLTRQVFELSLRIDPSETADLDLIAKHGWILRDPDVVAGNPWLYRQFIQQSRAELMVAKSMYVETGSGWFSDRSACFLASGRPVLAQDTGFSQFLPTGTGLVAFSTLEEAVDGVAVLSADYPHHVRMARALTEEFFDSDRVLGQLLDRIGV